METSREFRLSRSKMLDFLDQLDMAGGEAVTVVIPPGISPADARALLESALPSSPGLADLAGPGADSPTGAVVFWGSARKLLIKPPFPLRERYIAPGHDTEPLRTLLKRRPTVALVLVRLGAFAIGICQGEQLVTSKTGTGLVHGRHKKGGSSQRRFERHREAQMHHFLERVCGHTRQQLEAHGAEPDYVVYGGAWTTILALKKQCPLLGRFEGRTLPPLLEIAQPRRSVLESAIISVWSSRITEWTEEETGEIDSGQTGI